MSDEAASAVSEVELVAETLQAVANPNRIQLLTGLYDGRPRTALVDQLGISEGGVSNHLRTLADAGLLYRTEDGWQVTPLGVFFAILLEAHGDVVADARRLIAAARSEAADEYTDVPLPDQERKRAVEWRTWELVQDELEELLADRTNTGILDEGIDPSSQ